MRRCPHRGLGIPQRSAVVFLRGGGLRDAELTMSALGTDHPLQTVERVEAINPSIGQASCKYADQIPISGTG